MKYTVTFLLLIIISFVYSQETEIRDETEMRHPCDYLKISKNFIRTNYDSSLFYAEKALEQSILSGDFNSQGSALMRMGIVHYYKGNLNTADTLYQKASELFIKTNDILH